MRVGRPPAPGPEIPVAPSPRARSGRLLDLGEEAARRRWLEHYALVMGLRGEPGSWGAESHVDPVDWAEVLVPSHRGSTDGDVSVDVVVDVAGDLDAVRLGLWALLGKTGRPFHLVLVDSTGSAGGSEAVRAFVARHPYVTLVENPDPRHRRWKGENAGLAACGADIVVVLAAGAVVSQGWLDGLVDALDDPGCGLAGPLTNAPGGLQTFPHLAADGATNTLPPWLTPDGMALLLRGPDPPLRPKVPAVGRVCRAVRRDVLDRVGSFDGSDDYCERVREAGHGIVVADDSYVLLPRAKPPAEALTDDPLAGLRARVSPAMTSGAAVADALRTVRPRAPSVGFVMPNMAHGGSGGLHSVYQEASGLRRLGMDAVILANESYLHNARLAYEDADEVFVQYDSDDELDRLTRDRQVLVATQFKSVQLVAAVWDRRQDFLPAYYVQDYEPFFTVNVNGGAPDSLEARSSYDLIPGMLRFAKTHWICNAVGRVRRLPVAKVEPGIDERLFTGERGNLRPAGPVRVLGMVRPRTWRRQPFATLMMLDRLQQDLGDRVEVHSFGCTAEALDHMTGGHEHVVRHHGVLTRGEIAARLKETDVFLDLSAFQGMGRTGFEGMCCGCVPVMPRIGGAHEFAVHDETAVLVDTSDLASCYRDLCDLVLDPDRISRLQEAGVRAGRRRSVLAAVVSEYAVIDHEYRRRFGGAGNDTRSSTSVVAP